MFKITGNTYQAKAMLKEAGFEFDGAQKAWYGNEEALKELKRTATPTYSRANAKAYAGLTIEEV